LQYTSTAHGLEEELNEVFKAFPSFPGKQSFANWMQIVWHNPNICFPFSFLSVLLHATLTGHAHRHA
jgi:hypothetical protein